MQIELPTGASSPNLPDPLGSHWHTKFIEQHGFPPSEADRQDRLFTLLFPGSGEGGLWSTIDWSFYQSNKGALWNGQALWPAGSMPAGYDRFENHLFRLAGYYGQRKADRGKFARAAGLIWGGINYEGSVLKALAEASVGDHHLQLHEGDAGWNERFVDDSNPAHHWVAGFLTAFFFGEIAGVAVNTIRDIAQYITAQGGTKADIDLGNIAAEHGAFLAGDDADEPAFYKQLIMRMREDLKRG